MSRQEQSMDSTAEELGSSYTNVNNPERWLSVVAGSALAAYGLTRRSITGLVLAGLGGTLVWRGATGHCIVYEALGLSSAPREEEDSNVSIPYGKGIRVEKSVTISASPGELYHFWRNFENLPRFMSHLKSVKVIDSTRSHWVAKGPGTDAEWDAEIINEIPNQLIGWRSVNGSKVHNAGSVHFTPTVGDRGTEVKVILRYDPPAGILGAMAARLFGEDPARQVQEDLRTLKQIVETGERATSVRL
jgi:uncharacterized membrane protein